MPVHITTAHATKVKVPGRIYDSHRGLHLWVKKPTQKYWVFRCSKGGKRTDISLGAFPQVGPALARKKASELAELYAQGLDPIMADSSTRCNTV